MKPDGGPAFPTVARDGNWQPHHDGMTLRDYFAGQALASFAGNDAAGQYFKRDKDALAQNCYALADAMLAAREVAS